MGLLVKWLIGWLVAEIVGKVERHNARIEPEQSAQGVAGYVDAAAEPVGMQQIPAAEFSFKARPTLF